MKMDDLKYAFGSTPESVKDCIRRSLREEQRREPFMKRRMKLSMAAVLAVVLLLGCVGFAAAQLDGLAGVFGFTNHETGETVVNEAALKHITALNEVYEGKTVKFTLTEGMYSPLNSYISMGWTLEPLTEGEEYYILCNEKVGGSWLEAGSLRNVSEFILTSPVRCARTGYLTGEGLQTELTFSIMKLSGEIVRYEYDDEAENTMTRNEYLKGCYEKGKLPMAGDGMIETIGIKDGTYAEELVATGLVELAEEFTVSFDLGQVAPVDEHRAYEGEKTFTFEDFDIQIGRVVVTPGDSRIEFDLLFDKEITQEDIDTSACHIDIAVEGMEFWFKAGYPSFSAPEKTEDGRWKISVAYSTALQSVYPEELILSIVRYDEAGNPTPLTGEGIAMKLSDK